jgi:hypothetical protein
VIAICFVFLSFTVAQSSPFVSHSARILNMDLNIALHQYKLATERSRVTNAISVGRFIFRTRDSPSSVDVDRNTRRGPVGRYCRTAGPAAPA